MCYTLSNAVEHARGWVATKIGFDIITSVEKFQASEYLMLWTIMKAQGSSIERFFVSSGVCKDKKLHCLSKKMESHATKTFRS